MGIEEGLTPEAKARLNIDKQLVAAGWEIQNKDAANLSANNGFVAIRERPIAFPIPEKPFLNTPPSFLSHSKLVPTTPFLRLSGSRTKVSEPWTA